MADDHPSCVLLNLKDILSASHRPPELAHRRIDPKFPEVDADEVYPDVIVGDRSVEFPNVSRNRCLLATSSCRM